MEEVTQKKSKWLIIVLIFVDEHKYPDKEKWQMPTLEIEQGSWKKSIKETLIAAEDSINIVCATTRLTGYFQKSETKLETKFLVKEGKELKKFTHNNIGIKYKNRQYCSTDFEENIRKIDEHFTADNRIIITLGHGGLFGINSVSKTDIDDRTRSEEYSADITVQNKDNNLIEDKNRYKSFFADGSYFLSNAEISQTFLNIFKTCQVKNFVN